MIYDMTWYKNDDDTVGSDNKFNNTFLSCLEVLIGGKTEKWEVGNVW